MNQLEKKGISICCDFFIKYKVTKVVTKKIGIFTCYIALTTNLEFGGFVVFSYMPAHSFVICQTPSPPSSPIIHDLSNYSFPFPEITERNSTFCTEFVLLPPSFDYWKLHCLLSHKHHSSCTHAILSYHYFPLSM